MAITVRFFASLRESIGRERLDLEPPPAGAVDLVWLREVLSRELGAEALERIEAPGVRIAVNQRLIEGEQALGDGDEVAFLPPVTGG